jgi:putative holliday junction resolvase
MSEPTPPAGASGPAQARRALAVDYGEARIGIAAGDALGMLAHPVETIDRRRVARPEARIAGLAARHGCAVVVVGLPLRMDGSEGHAAVKARAFAARLRAALPDAVAIEFTDERLSTVEAQRHLRAAGRKARDQKAVIDQAAAVVILQDWLDQQRGPQALLLPDPWDEEENSGSWQ